MLQVSTQKIEPSVSVWSFDFIVLVFHCFDPIWVECLVKVFLECGWTSYNRPKSPQFKILFSRMSRVSLRSPTLILNIFGILSLKHEAGEFKTWRSLAVLNVLRIPFVLFLSSLLASSATLRKLAMKVDIDGYTTYSMFTTLTILLSGELLLVTLLFITFVNFFRSADMLEFMNIVRKLEINEQQARELQQKWNKHFVLMTSFLAIFVTLQFFTKMKVKWISLAVFPTIAYPYIAITAFLGFLKGYEIFLATLLSDFRVSLQLTLSQSKFDHKNYQLLVGKYFVIYELNEKFHQIFGAQVTATTLCVTIMTTLQVNHKNISIR